MEIKWAGDRIVDRIRAVANGKMLKEISYGSSGSTSGTARINLGGEYTITITAIDVYGYTYSDSLATLPGTDIVPIIDPGVPVVIDKTPPTITMTNPK